MDYQVDCYAKNGRLVHCGPKCLNDAPSLHVAMRLEAAWNKWRREYYAGLPSPSNPPRRPTVVRWVFTRINDGLVMEFER
jgi:hypothetical protein